MLFLDYLSRLKCSLLPCARFIFFLVSVVIDCWKRRIVRSKQHASCTIDVTFLINLKQLLDWHQLYHYLKMP